MTAAKGQPAVPPPPPPPVRRKVAAAALVVQLGKAKAELDAAQASFDVLVDRAREDLPLGRHISGGTEVLITRSRIWDKTAALDEHGDAICSPTVDMRQARLVLTGSAFEAYYSEQPHRVTVKKVRNPS